MQSLPSNVNPFALMIDPQAVFAKIESSERLERLHRRVCRPLDKPLLGGAADDAGDAGETLLSALDDPLARALDDPLVSSATDDATHALGQADGLTNND